MGTVTGFRSTPGEGYTTERVEIRPGVLIKMSPADRKAWEAANRPSKAPREQLGDEAEQASMEAPETATMPAPKSRPSRTRKA